MPMQPPENRFPLVARRIIVPALDGLRTYRRSALLIALVIGLAVGVALPVSWLADRTRPLVQTRLALPAVPGADLEAPGSLVTRTVNTTRQSASNAFYRFLLSGAAAMVVLGGLTALTLGAARNASRAPEQATRRAVGASSRSLLATTALEATVLLALALAIGLPAGLMGSQIAEAVWPGSVAGGTAVLAGVVLLTAVLTALASLVLPHLLAPRRQLSGESARSLTLMMPIIQLALSLIVLVTAGLIIRHARQQAAPAAIAARSGQLLDLRATGSAAGRGVSYRDLLRQLDSTPGLASASLTSAGTSRGLGTVESVLTDCGQCSEGGIYTLFKQLLVTEHLASPDTFRSLETPVVVGRGFTLQDDAGALPVAVVTRELARQGFQFGEAVGRDIRIRTGGPDANPDGKWFKVIGIVEDRPAAGYGFGLQPVMGVYLSILQQSPAAAELLLRPVPGSNSLVRFRPAGSDRPDSSIRILTSRSEAEVFAADLAPLGWFGRGFTLLGWSMLAIASLGAMVLMRAWLVSLLPELGLRWAVGATRGSLLRLVGWRVSQAVLAASIMALWVAPAVRESLRAILGPFADATDGMIAGYALLLAIAALLGLAGPLLVASRSHPAQLVEHAGE